MKSEKSHKTNTYHNYYASMHQQQYSQSNFDDLSSSSSSSLLYSPTSDFLLNTKDRKKRRGYIEKRRRDRINGCLSELKRLVPEAITKESSTKLEKAEILQLTVDYLRELNHNEKDKKHADELKQDGFKECQLEMSRYLTQHEGLDLQDALHMRLITHLQYFCEQNYQAKVDKSPSSQLASPSSAIDQQIGTYPQYVNNSAFVQINITSSSPQLEQWNNQSRISQPEVPQFYDGEATPAIQFTPQHNYWQQRGY